MCLIVRPPRLAWPPVARLLHRCWRCWLGTCPADQQRQAVVRPLRPTRRASCSGRRARRSSGWRRWRRRRTPSPRRSGRACGACRRGRRATRGSRERQPPDQSEGDLRAVQLRDRDRAVECDDRRRVEPGQLVVQRDHLRPVRVRRGGGVGGDGVDRGEYLTTAGSVDREALADQVVPLGDQRAVPVGAILLAERDQLPIWSVPAFVDTLRCDVKPSHRELFFVLGRCHAA